MPLNNPSIWFVPLNLKCWLRPSTLLFILPRHSAASGQTQTYRARAPTEIAVPLWNAPAPAGRSASPTRLYASTQPSHARPTPAFWLRHADRPAGDSDMDIGGTACTERKLVQATARGRPGMEMEAMKLVIWSEVVSGQYAGVMRTSFYAMHAWCVRYAQEATTESLGAGFANAKSCHTSCFALLALALAWLLLLLLRVVLARLRHCPLAVVLPQENSCRCCWCDYSTAVHCCLLVAR
jgi:hypothetical protein